MERIYRHRGKRTLYGVLYDEQPLMFASLELASEYSEGMGVAELVDERDQKRWQSTPPNGAIYNDHPWPIYGYFDDYHKFYSYTYGYDREKAPLTPLHGPLGMHIYLNSFNAKVLQS